MCFVKILLFLTLSSLIACSPMKLCSSVSSENSTKTIINLNDDCLYETLKFVDIEDLNNLAESNPRFKPVAEEMFIKKAFEILENFRTLYMLHYREVLAIANLKSRIVDAFMPKFSQMDFSGFKLVFSLKFIKFTSFIGLRQFVDESLNKHISVKQYAKILTLNDHYQLLSHFHEKFADGERFQFKEFCGWFSFAYMTVLSQSEHLDKRFNYNMMLAMNKARNAANAYYLLQTNKNSSESEFEYHEKFELNFDLYKGDVSTEKGKNHFRLALAKDEVQELRQYYLKYVEKPIIEVFFANTYCAIRRLSGPNFIELVDESNLNIALFKLSESFGVVGKLHKSLLKECQGAKAIENDLRTQFNPIDKLVGEQGNRDDYEILLNRFNVPLSDYLRKFNDHIGRKAESLRNAPNLTEYIDLLKICVKIDQYNINSVIKKTIERLHFVYFNFVNHSHVFDDFDQLNEIDQLTNQLTDDYGDSKLSDATESQFIQLLRLTLENFASIMKPTVDDSKEVRTKQRIVLKFLIFTAYGARFRRFGNQAEEIAGYFVQIFELFNALVDVDVNAESIVKDKHLMHYWYGLGNDVTNWIRKYGSSTAETFERVFSMIEQPYNLSGNSAKDLITYINHLTAAQWLGEFDNKNLSNQTLDNILLLEESVGDAITFADFVRDHMAKVKNSFHERFMDAVRDRQAHVDLKKYVNSMIDRIFNPSRNYIIREIKTLNSIFIAVQNVGESAKVLIGKELIATLGDISHAPDYSLMKERDHLKKNVYDSANELLNFKESMSVYWKY